jgi:hypothetical protein
VAALLGLLPTQQQQQTEVQQALVICIEAMVKAASAMLLCDKDTAVRLQLAQLCIATGLQDRLFTAMSVTSAQLQATGAEVAAALAAGHGLPVQYRPQQRDIPLPARLAIVLAGLHDAVCICWPGPLLLSAHAGKIVLPATQLLLAALRLALRLLAGGNRDISCKLLGSCLQPAVGIAVMAMAGVGRHLEPAEVQLLRSHELPQLQLLLLTLGIKLRCNEQHIPGRPPSGSSSSNRRQQQHQCVELDSARHRRLLAMLQEWGLSEQQAAAPLPQALALKSMPIVHRNRFKHITEQFRISTTVVQGYLAMGRHQAPEPEAAALSDAQRAAYRELLRITQLGALMLLEAAHNLFVCAPQLAADASEGAVACTLCMLLQTTAVANYWCSSSASAGEVHASGDALMGVAAASGADGGVVRGSSNSGTSTSIHMEVINVEVAQVVKSVSGTAHL